MNISLISTGGTILSRPSARGLVPAGDAGYLLAILRSRFPNHDFSMDVLMSLDSSNMQPEHWRQVASSAYRAVMDSDGVIIVHGTDTMAYASSALSFMLRHPGKPVTLTGSQIPSEQPDSDAFSNLSTAVAALEHDIRGVSVSFFRKVINGTRAVKVSTWGLDAFASVGTLPMAFFDESGSSVRVRETRAGDDSPPSLETDICPDVCLIKLVPGTNPAIFNAMADIGYRGMVVEAFGAGGVHSEGRDLAAAIGKTVASGIPVAVCSQCLEGRVDLSLYEVGRRIMDSGVIPAGDMTTEATVAKLMWALGRTSDIGEIEKIFNTNYAGEITL